MKGETSLVNFTCNKTTIVLVSGKLRITVTGAILLYSRIPLASFNLYTVRGCSSRLSTTKCSRVQFGT